MAGVRLLSERVNHRGSGAPRQDSESNRRPDPRGHEYHAVPLHDLLPGPGCHQARGGGHGGEDCMRTFTGVPRQIEDLLEEWSATLTRRTFLKGSGLLAVSAGAAAIAGPFAADASAQTAGLPRQSAGGATAGPYPDPDFHQLDSWIVVHENNTATFYVGKTDCGQGTGTAFRQMMSDELDIAYEKTSCIMGSTDITVDQGGSGGSDAIQTEGWPMRRVAAEARRVLLDMAAARLAVPVGQLVVKDALVSVGTDSSQKVTYGELI